MTDLPDYEELAAHLSDLQEKSELWHSTICSSFLSEEEQGAMKKYFPASDHIVYDGGYAGARKKKIIFRYDGEDTSSDIVCISAKIDQRFRKIGHRDILGALMHLQIERSSFGDFWIEDENIYLYTSETMAGFLIDNLIRINQLSVSFERIEEKPVQVFHTKRLETVIASERLDAMVAGLTHCSRSKAKEMIQHSLVQINHVPVDRPDITCKEDDVISIRGTGRFTFKGITRKTRNDRIAAVFLQDI
ncbi:MAG: RNA-binding protein [Solobacterium sp.]|nr:RNA-binding protein [Solobacterium sp.]